MNQRLKINSQIPLDPGEGQHVLIPSQKMILLAAGKVASGSLKAVGLEVEGTLKKISTDQISQYRGFYRVAVYRDPIMRLASCWRDKIRIRFRRAFRRFEGIYPRMPFNDFAAVVTTIPDSASDGHFRSQSCFYLDARGNPLFDVLLPFRDLNRVWRSVVMSKYPAIPMLSFGKRVTHNRLGIQPEPLTEEIVAALRIRYCEDYKLAAMVNDGGFICDDCG